ncbi:hypothetical protein JL100_016945 [Skermanella mucosa]|uniref:hypothetical protein n=1 Tax=Skermanella mucosa TaxID=1789672 RepID=UPI00192A9101|nr:hypothetical protein [Skermanella mucosa]UEM18784.1 hypothetical protein JL100_016945 [Skermanella mucosa]
MKIGTGREFSIIRYVPFKSPLRPLAGAALAGALLVSGCAVEQVTDQAYSTVQKTGVFDRVAERTGINALFDEAAAQYAEAMATDERSLDTVGVPLSTLASGIVMGPRPPDLVHEALTEIAAENGPAVARRMMIAMATGGTMMVTGLPAMADGAMSAHDKLVAAQEAQAQVDAAYAASEATRAETALVPDEDRPHEAAALLKLVDEPAGSKLAWSNRATGAGGIVSIGAAETSKGDDGRSAAVTCRTVIREYFHGAVSRGGVGTICREHGVWYDLS